MDRGRPERSGCNPYSVDYSPCKTIPGEPAPDELVLFILLFSALFSPSDIVGLPFRDSA